MRAQPPVPGWPNSGVGGGTRRCGLQVLDRRSLSGALPPKTPLTPLQLREMSPLWEMVQEGIDLKSIEWAQH